MHSQSDQFEEEPLPEGEEQAPPLTRTMGIIRWGILGAMAIFALVMILGYFGLAPWTAEGNASTQYHCPMHPTYISSQPGDCPICGMSLVPIESSKSADSDTVHPDHTSMGKESIAKPGQYYCPMDPEIASDSAGRCSVCGMFLEKFEPGMQFSCENHPEVIVEHPGDCPKCGGDLSPLAATAPSAGQHDAGTTTVPGLVSITLEPQRLQLIGLRTEKATRTTMQSTQKLLGYVVPDETTLRNLSLRVGGWVRELAANQTGQLIHAGDRLLTIYSQDLHRAVQDYRLALSSELPAKDKESLVNASRTRLRNLGLSDAEISSMESADADASTITLVSPVTGVILSRNVSASQYVSPAEILFSIANLKTVWVIADVFEADLANIRNGQAARLTTTAMPGREFEGKVSFVYPTISVETRTAKVRIELSNPDLVLKPGMYAEINVVNASMTSLAISPEAVLDGGEVAYVFVVTNGNHFSPRKVTVGRRTDEKIEILAGLTEGETVVTSANFLIDSESRLQAAITGMGGSQEHPMHGDGE